MTSHPIVFGKKKIMRLIKKIKTAFYVIALCSMATLGAKNVSAGVLGELGGTWRGNGRVAMQDGHSEKVRCTVISSVQMNGTRAYQKVKCKSASNNINVHIKLSEKAQKISGSWSASGVVEGSIYGKADGRSMKLHLNGYLISAALNLTTSACTQKMALSGKIGNIRKLTVNLRKSC